MTMKLAPLSCSLFASISLLASGVTAAFAEQLTLRLAHPFAVNGPEDRANHKFAEIIKEKSNGRITAEIFPAGQIGGFQQIFQGMPSGLAHAIFISSDTLGLIEPVVSVTVWPFLFDSKEEFDCAYQQPEAREYLALVEETTGFRALSPAYKGARHLYSTRPVNSVDDIAGLKIRVAPIPVYSKPWEVLGAVPTGLDFSEAYTALSQGVVDAVEIELPTAVASRFHEVAKNVVLTRHAMDNYSWIFHAEWLDNLPEEDRLLVEQAAAESAAWFAEETVKAEAKILEDFRTAGATIQELDSGILRDRVHPEMIAAMPEMAEWAEKLRAAGGRCQ